MIDDRGTTYFRDDRYELKRGNHGFSCADWDERQIVFTVDDDGIVKYITEDAEKIYKYITDNLTPEFKERFHDRIS